MNYVKHCSPKFLHLFLKHIKPPAASLEISVQQCKLLYTTNSINFINEYMYDMLQNG